MPIPWLEPAEPFPPLERALKEPNGLLAVGRSLTTATLVEAYSRGIFPWFNDGEPVLWWSPDPRMVLFPSELHVSTSLARRIRRRDLTITADTAFGRVMEACAAPRDGQQGTWISARMIAAYERLHLAGYAHSVEAWAEGDLVGGLYGVAIGRVFFGESMFARRADASKVAFVHLVRQLETWSFGLIDCQMRTEHLARFGAREIPRAEFAARLERLVQEQPVPAPWTLAPGGADAAAPL